MLRSLVAALALFAAASAQAAVDLEARRLTFDRPDGIYLPSDRATLTLAYEADGSGGNLSEVFLRVEIATDPPTRITYVINEVRVPSGPREFVMKVDLLDRKVPEGRFGVTATLDSKDLVAEMDEGNNTSRTTLEVRRSGGSTSGSTPSTTTTPSGARRLAPRDARTVSQTSCSELERAWKAPMEAGWHPGFGAASVTLTFDHPLTVPRSGERIRRSRLVIAGTVQGRPFATLGPLEVVLRSLGARDARCATPRDLRTTHDTIDGVINVDLGALLRDAESLPWECADRLQATLSFPKARTAPSDAALLVLDPERTGVDVEIER